MTPTEAKRALVERCNENCITPLSVRVRKGEAIAFITPYDASSRILDSGMRTAIYRPLGLFIAEDERYTVPDTDIDIPVYVAMDNSGGCCWTEEFHTLDTALEWLVGDIEDTESAHLKDLRRLELHFHKTIDGPSAAYIWILNQKAEWNKFGGYS